MSLEPMIRALQESQHLERAGAAVLDAVCAALRGAFAGIKGEVSLRRVGLMMRDGAGPRGLVWRPEDDQDVEGRPSFTAERIARQKKTLVLIDLLAGGPVGAAAADNFSSRTLFQRRGVTHICAIPLVDPGGLPVGCVLAELKTRANNAALEDACQAAYRTLAPALYVAALALPRMGREPLCLDDDPDIPVVGPELSGVLQDLSDYADTDDAILLRGETGTGKTHLARWCHKRSRVAKGPFIVAQLHEFPADLRAAQLFGYVRGAFTGATHDQPGLLAQARDGTLFIDEIDKLDTRTQGMLLRLLDSGEFQPIGDKALVRSNARIILGTNAALEELVHQGQFLEDLFYRIDVLSCTLPPLRQRPGDLARWAAWFAAQCARERGLQVQLAPEAESCIRAHDWPGNLRELESTIKRAFHRASREGPHPVILEERHLLAAMRAPARRPRGLLAALHEAAAQFVEAARSGVPLELRDAEAFRGFVLRAGAERLGLRQTYQLFGHQKAIEQGNHQRLYREQVAAAESLEAKLRAR